MTKSRSFILPPSRLPVESPCAAPFLSSDGGRPIVPERPVRAVRDLPGWRSRSNRETESTRLQHRPLSLRVKDLSVSKQGREVPSGQDFQADARTRTGDPFITS